MWVCVLQHGFWENRVCEHISRLALPGQCFASFLKQCEISLSTCTNVMEKSSAGRDWAPFWQRTAPSITTLALLMGLDLILEKHCPRHNCISFVDGSWSHSGQALPHVKQHQWFVFSQNIAYVTPNSKYFGNGHSSTVTNVTCIQWITCTRFLGSVTLKHIHSSVTKNALSIQVSIYFKKSISKTFLLDAKVRKFPFT